MAAPKIAAEYIGTDTEHLGGIPARDLTDDELDALPEDRRAELLANAEGPDPAYKLHGTALKAEAKEMAAGETGTISGDGSGTALPPLPDSAYPAGSKPLDTSNVPKASTKAADTDRPANADAKAGDKA